MGHKRHAINWPELWDSLDAATKERSRELRQQAMKAYRQEPLLTEPQAAKAAGLTTAELRSRSAVSELIKLPCPQQGNLYPAFQFSGGKVNAAAAQVNKLFRSEDDPRGTMSWWHSQNGWIGCRPVDLIGTDAEDTLTELAQAYIDFDK